MVLSPQHLGFPGVRSTRVAWLVFALIAAMGLAMAAAVFPTHSLENSGPSRFSDTITRLSLGNDLGAWAGLAVGAGTSGEQVADLTTIAAMGGAALGEANPTCRGISGLDPFGSDSFRDLRDPVTRA